MLYTKSITSPLGPLFLASDGTAITGLWLEHQKYFGSTLTGTPEECPNLLVFEEAEAWLAAYFAKAPLPALPPLAPQGSPFRQAVWRLLSEIPCGTVTTYGELARKLRENGIPAAPQAVGRKSEQSTYVCPGRGRCSGPQPHLHSDPLPPGCGDQRQPHRLCRRDREKAISAGAGRR